MSVAFVMTTLVGQAAIDQKVMSEVKESEVQSVINAQQDLGYIPVWIDGFQHSTQNGTNPGKKLTFFNLVFEKVSNPDDYQVFAANSLIVYPNGASLKFLESYINGAGNIRFALVIKTTGGSSNFDAYHGLSANFQAEFNAKKQQGYHLENRSVVNKNGQNYTTALFVKSNVGTWISKSGLTQAQATAEMTANKNAGRTLVHMDIPYATSAAYNLVFHQSPANSGWYAQNGLTKQQLAVAVSNAKNQGYRTTIVCGYEFSVLVNGNETFQTRYAVTFVKPAGSAEGVGGYTQGG